MGSLPLALSKAKKLLEKLDGVTIEYKPMKYCGSTPFLGMLGLKNKLKLSGLAWNCCVDQSLAGPTSIASVILHELRHQGQVIPSEKEPLRLEAACFGCRIK